MEQLLASLLNKFTYVALVAVLSAAGLGVPISEDLTLLIAGAIAAQGITLLWPTLVAGYLGCLLGDVLIYQWGRRMGPLAYAQVWVQRVLSLDRQERLRAHFAKHGGLTVVVGRHTPGLRAPIFFLAGASGVPLWKFFLADALSAVVTVPIVTWLGFKFGEHLDEIRAHLHQAQWVVAGVVAGALFIWWVLRRFADTA